MQTDVAQPQAATLSQALLGCDLPMAKVEGETCAREVLSPLYRGGVKSTENSREGILSK